MAKGRREIPPCCKTYGFPIYFAACVPFGLIVAINDPVPDKIKFSKTRSVSRPRNPHLIRAPTATSMPWAAAALGGPGYQMPSTIILSAFNFAMQSLFDNPVSNSALKP